MTLPSLLRRMGVDVTRGVSVDGRLLTGRAAAAAVAASTATSVAPHTFHGGEDPPPRPDSAPWWHHPAARQTDMDAVARAFPTFRLDEREGRHAWSGTLDTGRGRYAVQVVADAAGGLPRIVPERPRRLGRNEGRRGFVPSPHLYISGDLCVAGVSDWDAARHTSATAIAWAAHWYAAYTDWRFGGPWPTDGYRPNAAA